MDIKNVKIKEQYGMAVMYHTAIDDMKQVILNQKHIYRLPWKNPMLQKLTKNEFAELMMEWL